MPATTARQRPAHGRSGKKKRTAPSPRSNRLLWIAGVAVLVAGAVVLWFMLRPTNPDFDEARAFEDLKQQVAFGPRVPGTPAHEATRQFLVQTLNGLSDRVVEQPFTFRHPQDSSKTYAGTNIIASFNLKATRRVLLAAHWDTRPVAGEDPNAALRDTPGPGANDGASGVAVLLEMARIMKAQPPDLGVDLVLFDLEDLGKEVPEGDSVRVIIPFAVGSEFFAANSQGYRPAYGILLDMVGDKNLRLPREANSAAAAPHVVNAVWAAARRVGSDAFLNQAGLAVYDDHIPFLKRDIPVIDLIHQPFPDTWHTHQDTPENCSPESLEQVGNVLVELIYGEQ